MHKSEKKLLNDQKFFGQLIQLICFAGYEQPPKPTSTYDNTGYNTDSYGHNNHHGTYRFL